MVSEKEGNQGAAVDQECSGEGGGSEGRVPGMAQSGRKVLEEMVFS